MEEQFTTLLFAPLPFGFIFETKPKPPPLATLSAIQIRLRAKNAGCDTWTDGALKGPSADDGSNDLLAMSVCICASVSKRLE